MYLAPGKYVQQTSIAHRPGEVLVSQLENMMKIIAGRWGKCSLRRILMRLLPVSFCKNIVLFNSGIGLCHPPPLLVTFCITWQNWGIVNLALLEIWGSTCSLMYGGNSK